MLPGVKIVDLSIFDQLDIKKLPVEKLSVQSILHFALMHFLEGRANSHSLIANNSKFFFLDIVGFDQQSQFKAYSN